MKDIVLRGGLDEVSPKPMTVPGTLADCFNYEVGIYPGYAPSAGFERFDGHISPSNIDIWDMTISNVSIEPAWIRTIDATNTAQTPTAIALSDNGSYLFLLGNVDDKIYRHYLSTPWDISTATIAQPTTPFLSTDGTPTSLRFSPDGVYVFYLGVTTDRVYRSTLRTPWYTDNNAFGPISFFVGTQQSSPQGLAFSPDGTRMYVCGVPIVTTSKVHQYSLTTAWDVSTASIVAGSENLALYSSNPRGIEFTSNGYMFYLADFGGVIHYFVCTTAWDITTAEWVKSYDTGYTLTDIYLSPDDSALYAVSKDGTYYVDQYAWGFAPNEAMEWVLSADSGDGVQRLTETTGSLGVAISQSVGATETTIRFAYWDSNDKLPPASVVVGSNGANFTAGLGSLAYRGSGLDVSGEAPDPTGAFFKPDGLSCYVVDVAGYVYQYTLTTPWDVSTGAYATKVVNVGFAGTPQGVALSSDGLKLFVATEAGVDTFTCSSAWDINGATNAFETLNVLYCYGLAFNPDGTKIYLVSGQPFTDNPISLVYELPLATAWDVSTAVIASQVEYESGPALGNGAFEESWATGITFSDDGLTFYLTYPTLEEIHQYTCTTAWDLSTAAQTDKVFWANQIGITDIAVTDIFLSGPYVYLTDSINDKVYWYELYQDAGFTALIDSATDVDDYQDQLATAAAVLREAITPVPGSGPVLAEKYYKDQLYAVRDYFYYNFREGSTVVPKVGQHVLIQDGATAAGSDAIYGDEGIVREIDVQTGTLAGNFADDDAHGKILIEPLTNSFAFTNRLGTGITNNALTVLAELYFTSGSTEPVAGAILDGATSTNSVTVWRVELRSGAWADGDAAGVIYCTRLSGALTDGEVMDQSSPSVSANVMTAEAEHPTVYGASLAADMIYHSPINTGASQAGLYRSTRTGWEKIELGHEVRFDTGTTEPTPVVFGADTIGDGVTALAVATSDWATSTVSQADNPTSWAASAGTRWAAVGASGGTYAYVTTANGTGSLKEAAAPMGQYDMGISIPVGSRIVGLEIEITAKNVDAATHDAALMQIQPFMYEYDSGAMVMLDGVQEKRQSVGDLTAAFVAYTFGGENDLWGLKLDRDTVMEPGFGVSCSMEWDDGATLANMQIDFIRVRVHYVEQGTLIYFYDSVGLYDYAIARLVHVNTETGDWGVGNDATGTFEIYDLTKPQIPMKNIQIRNAAGGAGSLIANCVGTERMISLPGRKLLNAVNSKYELITENVFARDDLEAMYGCNGAGLAFSYDSYYVRLIHSGLSLDLDKPRHIALFQFRLWLGYIFGEAAISVGGNPLLFDGSLNAVATGFGRPITGFSPLAGKTMGVFTDRSVYAVTVGANPSSGDVEFDQQVFAPRAGAIEYSIENVGTQAMYADSQGISTPQTIQEYGDFGINRISKAVAPWLLPRVIRRERPEARGRTDAVSATISRSKNQYRLYFADGYRLTLTLGAAGELPQITRQFLYLNNDTDQYMRILATDSEVGTNGQERLFFSMDINPDYDHGDALGYCYEEDRGLSFDGSVYARWIELVPIAGENIHQNNVWSVLHLYGLTHGFADLQLTTGLDFAHPGDPDVVTEDALYRLGLGAATNAVSSDLQAYWDKDRVEKRGRHLALRIQSSTDRELPHVLQLIGLAESVARDER